jgi:hypothetical protein
MGQTAICHRIAGSLSGYHKIWESRMSWWRGLFGQRERPEETLRLTRRVLDLLGEGKSDEEVERTLFREGTSVQRARSLVAEVRRVQRLHGR